MDVAAIVVAVPEDGAVGFDGPLLPAVGRFRWTVVFGGFVVAAVDVVAVVVVDGDPRFALEVDVLADGLAPPVGDVDVGVGGPLPP